MSATRLADVPMWRKCPLNEAIFETGAVGHVWYYSSLHAATVCQLCERKIRDEELRAASLATSMKALHLLLAKIGPCQVAAVRERIQRSLGKAVYSAQDWFHE